MAATQHHPLDLHSVDSHTQPSAHNYLAKIRSHGALHHSSSRLFSVSFTPRSNLSRDFVIWYESSNRLRRPGNSTRICQPRTVQHPMTTSHSQSDEEIMFRNWMRNPSQQPANHTHTHRLSLTAKTLLQLGLTWNTTRSRYSREDIGSHSSPAIQALLCHVGSSGSSMRRRRARGTR